MDIRQHIAMVFHLDKCIGCHTCSLACKNLWTDRKGAEYQWWNNVETKPGTGYPLLWEDQERYRGGWVKTDTGNLRLALQGRLGSFANLFYNPRLPKLDDYYHPWTYDYSHLTTAKAGDDQPTARPISAISGKPIDITGGPNWDDDLGGSEVYAENDVNLHGFTQADRDTLFAMESLMMFYLPRMCNHCMNPACVASCPSGAMYKRGEDGIVLVNQDACRSWRMCVSACPYKKVYFNWHTGRSEKCIACFPRQEAGLAPACFHSCVGKVRYLGTVLYDAEKIAAIASAPEQELVERSRDLFLDPHDPEISAQALAQGVSESVLEAARRSPVYDLVKRHRLALPLHPEFRTLPMLFYVPPLLPMVAKALGDGISECNVQDFTSADASRAPLRYLASLFAAGDEAPVREACLKLAAVRTYRRAMTIRGSLSADEARTLELAGLTPADAEAIFSLTVTAPQDERMVVGPYQREEAIEALNSPLIERNFGYDSRIDSGVASHDQR